MRNQQHTSIQKGFFKRKSKTILALATCASLVMPPKQAQAVSTEEANILILLGGFTVGAVMTVCGAYIKHIANTWNGRYGSDKGECFFYFWRACCCGRPAWREQDHTDEVEQALIHRTATYLIQQGQLTAAQLLLKGIPESVDLTQGIAPTAITNVMQDPQNAETVISIGSAAGVLSQPNTPRSPHITAPSAEQVASVASPLLSMAAGALADPGTQSMIGHLSPGLRNAVSAASPFLSAGAQELANHTNSPHSPHASMPSAGQVASVASPLLSAGAREVASHMNTPKGSHALAKAETLATAAAPLVTIAAQTFSEQGSPTSPSSRIFNDENTRETKESFVNAAKTFLAKKGHSAAADLITLELLEELERTSASPETPSLSKKKERKSRRSSRSLSRKDIDEKEN